MITRIVEVTNGFNWGKFMLARFDAQEWNRRSPVSESAQPLLREIGWSPAHLWVLDLQTGEGALFRPGGLARADLNKHKIWVCPLYEPFLTWLYTQDTADLSLLPETVELPKADSAIWGYRRPGSEPVTPRVWNGTPDDFWYAVDATPERPFVAHHAVLSEVLSIAIGALKRD